MNPSEVLARFQNVPFDLELELGNLDLSIGEILALQPGSVIRTDHPEGAPFQVRAGGVAFANAEVVVSGETVSLRINELLEKTGKGAGHGTN